MPELERAPKAARLRPWSQDEIALLARYYGKVPIQQLARVLRERHPPGRTYDAIKCKARQLRALGLI